MRILRVLLVLLLLGAIATANASVRASLDRDRIALGDAVTLTIASDASGAQPDLAPLRADFDVRGISTGSQTTIVNGSMQSSTQWTVALVPKRAGTIEIPMLAVGRERTSPLRVDVEANATVTAQPTAATTSAAPVFIETSIEPTNPYVQQAMVYTLRLYYAVTLLDGALDAPTPDNGDLRQIGDDVTNSAVVQGRRYNVLERHYLLQPERSGALHIPSPTFHGRAMEGVDSMFDDRMPGNGGAMRAAGKPIDVQVRARPAQAGDPWIPARALTLSVQPPGPPVHVGEPFSIVVKIDGEGVTAAQLPEIALPTIADAQVYPEPSSTSEQQRDGRLLAERTRRFAIVPDRAGEMRLPELTMPWWDIVNDHAALARVALPALHVLPGTMAPSEANAGASPGAEGADNISATTAAASTNASVLHGWQIATACLAALLGLALWRGWRRGHVVAVVDRGRAPMRAPNRAPTLMRALALGDPSAIAQALLEAAPGSPARNLAEVAQRLEQSAQRNAVLAFDAARWSTDGTPSVQVLAALREAFKQPPRWTGRTASTSSNDALPPLYP